MKFSKLTLSLALLLAVCLPAAAQGQTLRLNVPFDFVVAGKTLPAGQYDVKRVSTADNITWAIDGDHSSIRFTTLRVESPKTPHAPSLVFLQGGGRYSLVQIWDEEHSGRELPRSHVKQTLVADQGKFVAVGAQ